VNKMAIQVIPNQFKELTIELKSKDVDPDNVVAVRKKKLLAPFMIGNKYCHCRIFSIKARTGTLTVTYDSDNVGTHVNVIGAIRDVDKSRLAYFYHHQNIPGIQRMFYDGDGDGADDEELANSFIRKMVQYFDRFSDHQYPNGVDIGNYLYIDLQHGGQFNAATYTKDIELYVFVEYDIILRSFPYWKKDQYLRIEGGH